MPSPNRATQERWPVAPGGRDLCPLTLSDFQDLARLFIWVLREYDEVEPIILSGGHPVAPLPLPRGRTHVCAEGSWGWEWECGGGLGSCKAGWRRPHLAVGPPRSPQWARRMRSLSRRQPKPWWRPWTSTGRSLYPLALGQDAVGLMDAEWLSPGSWRGGALFCPQSSPGKGRFKGRLVGRVLLVL